MPWKYKVRLSITGMMKVAEGAAKTVKGITEKFDWSNAVCDAGILAGITFFTALSGIKIADVETTRAFMGASISAGLQFLTILALKRKLIKSNGGAK